MLRPVTGTDVQAVVLARFGALLTSLAEGFRVSVWSVFYAIASFRSLTVVISLCLRAAQMMFACSILLLNICVFIAFRNDHLVVNICSSTGE